MKKTVAAVLLLLLLSSHALYAASPNDIPPPSSNVSQPAPETYITDQESGHSPGAQTAYKATGIVTLVVAGTCVASGVYFSKVIGVDEVSSAFYTAGGVLFAASTVLWILYAREKGKEPRETVGLELDKGKVRVMATLRF
ncbi:MAG TPA: hypothetical protein VK654_03680 [Nitrospirota bacterium]|nr:hypothetical protein [Nitrospirota bacterium]